MNDDKIENRSGALVLAELLPPALKQLPWEERSKGKKAKSPFSRFKLVVIYRDQNSRTYFSWDYYYHFAAGERYRILDEREGLIKLMRYTKNQIEADNLISAMIYSAQAHDTDTSKQHYDFALYKYTRNKVNKMQPYDFDEMHRQTQRKLPMKAIVDTTLDLKYVNGIWQA